MKERCRDGCRTSLLIAGVVLVPNIFHTLLPPCHPYITTHFMEMIFSTCIILCLILSQEVSDDTDLTFYDRKRLEAEFRKLKDLKHKAEQYALEAKHTAQ